MEEGPSSGAGVVVAAGSSAVTVAGAEHQVPGVSSPRPLPAGTSFILQGEVLLLY